MQPIRINRLAAIRAGVAWYRPCATTRLLVVAATVTVGLMVPAAAQEPMAGFTKLDRELPLLGHHNWIVIADSAYPLQSRPGIETLYLDADQVRVVERVLRAVDSSGHVHGTFYVDAELPFVSEQDAPGISAYRSKLGALLRKRGVRTMPHEQLIAKLDESAKLFRVLVIKTNLALPYATVFIKLECGYWNAAAEKRLRRAMGTARG